MVPISEGIGRCFALSIFLVEGERRCFALSLFKGEGEGRRFARFILLAVITRGVSSGGLKCEPWAMAGGESMPWGGQGVRACHGEGRG